MRIFYEDILTNYKPWLGAIDNYKTLKNDEITTLEDYLEELYPEGISETMLNDIFWFEMDWVNMVLGKDTENEDEEED